jgi:hypothetical protein
VASTVDLHKGKVTTGLDLAVLLAVVLEVLDLGVAEILLARPLELVGPCLVTEPVADEVGITSIDENGDLVKNVGDELVVGLHPVTSKEEVSVDVHVAAVVAADLNTKSLLDLFAVQVVGDVTQARVAEVGAILTLASNVVDILAGALVGTHHGVVAVDAGGDTRPGTAGLVATLDQRLAAGQSVVHGLALAVTEDRGVATLTAGHGAVVGVLGVAIGKTVTNKNTLEVDVAVIVGENLVGKHGDVVTSIGLASNVKVLLGILGELVEEQSEESIDVLASSNSVAHRATTVGIAYVDGLIEEDNGSVVVPGLGVVDELDLLVDGSRSKLKEETSQGRAARATVKPEYDRVVLGVVTGLEEPFEVLVQQSIRFESVHQLTVEEVLVFLLIVKITTVLLDLVNAELCRVDLLGTEIEVVEFSANLTMLLAILLDPEGLDISTLDDVIPVGIGPTVGLLGLGQDLLLESLNSVGGKKSDLVPDSLGL